MACEILHPQGCYIDGEQKLYGSAADYVAGMAAKMTTNGVDVALTPGTVNGIFKNNKAVDASTRVGPQVGDTPDQSDLRATVIKGVFKVKLTPGTLLAGTTATPWISSGGGGAGGGGAWAVGQLLYVTGAGKWDNVAAAPGDQAFGVVTKAPASATDSLEADMWPFFTNNDS